MSTRTFTPPEGFEGYFRWYMAQFRRRRGRSPSTRTLEAQAMQLDLMSRIEGRPGEQVFATVFLNRGDTEDLLSRLHERMEPSSTRNYIFTLRLFGEYAKSKGWVRSVPLLPEDVPAMAPLPDVTCYTAEEMESFVSAARGRDLRLWALFAYLVDTGRRVGETLDLQWDWFRLDASPAHIELPARFTKSKTPQMIPLSKRLAKQVFTEENVRRMKVGTHSNPQWQFKHKSPLEYPFPWTYDSAKARFKDLCKVTGFPYRGFHNFRHTVITERIARGVPIQAVAALAGHSTPAVTMARYSHATALDYAKYLDAGGDD